MRLSLLIAASAATVAAAPLAAESRTAVPQLDQRPAVDGSAIADRVDRPRADTGPIVSDRGPPEPNWGQINRQLYARAKAAVEGGADPAEVRQKLQDYKQHLRRRWNNANQGG